MASSRVSPLHKTFAVIWLSWYAALVPYTLFAPHLWYVDALIGIVFGIVEWRAVRTSKTTEWRGSLVAMRDSLSEHMTWLARMAKPGTPWYASWNGLVVLLSLFPSYLLARNVPAFDILSLIGLSDLTFAMMEGFLVLHWLRPDKY